MERAKRAAPDTGAPSTVAEAGERGVLRRVLDALSGAEAEAATVGPGDDSAVLRLSGELVVTSDTMIEGPDFRLDWHDGFDLGWKLAATNLSDVAAMGARPIGLTVALACPGETEVSLLEEIARGLSAACRELAPGCGVVGGDLSTAPVLTAAVTALGDMQGRDPVLRSGARPGDVLAYSGQLGLAGLGLSLLFREASTHDSKAVSRAIGHLRDRHPAALAAQFAPRPPILDGILAAEHGATAMMDVSDGLSLDASRLAEASGVAIAFDSAALQSEFGHQGGQAVSLEHLLSGGEDHGMLVTFPRGAELPGGFRTVGEVRGLRADGERVLLDDGPLRPRGWDPYAGSTIDG